MHYGRSTVGYGVILRRVNGRSAGVLMVDLQMCNLRQTYKNVYSRSTGE